MAARVVTDETNSFGLRRVCLDVDGYTLRLLIPGQPVFEATIEAVAIPVEPGTSELPSLRFRFPLEAGWEAFRTPDPGTEERILAFVDRNDPDIAAALRVLVARS